MPVLFFQTTTKKRSSKLFSCILIGQLCLNIHIYEKLNLSSPNSNFVDVNNQVGRKSIIWQNLWQDKESEKYVLITFWGRLITIYFFIPWALTKTDIFWHPPPFIWLWGKISPRTNPSSGKSLLQNPSRGKSLPAKCLHT